MLWTYFWDHSVRGAFQALNLALRSVPVNFDELQPAGGCPQF